MEDSRCKYCDRKCRNRCGRCKTVNYCTYICQTLDWPRHKLNCRRNGDDLNDNEKNVAGQEDQCRGKFDYVTSSNTINNDMAGTNNPCGFCNLFGCTKKCPRCKITFYCSTECQKQDWNKHKSGCKKALTEEDERILKCWKRKEDHVAMTKNLGNESCFINNFTGPGDRFYKTLTRKQALLRSTPPNGSLAKAIQMTKMLFPVFKVVSTFADIPTEYVRSMYNLMGVWNEQYVLVAFMYRFHEHAMRHGVYLKDDQDNESKVEFYLDEVGNNPLPYFSLSQVKPGGYICLKAPVVHRFFDGTVGIRIDRPEAVRVLPIDDVMKTSKETIDVDS